MKAVALSIAVAVSLAACNDAPSAPQNPQQVVEFVSVSAGGTHACALDKAGHVWCWGANRTGEDGVPLELCGAGSSVCLELARMISDSSVFTSVVAGYNASCALKADGSAYCWGADDADQLGSAPRPSIQCDFTPCSYTPVAVSGGFRFKSISAGMRSACGITLDGVGKCWGYNNGSTLGNPSRVSSSAMPLTVTLSATGDSAWEVVDRAGYYSNCGVTSTTHAVACWGLNTYGQLGTGSISATGLSQPQTVTTPVALHAVTSGDVANCALDAGNAAWCWGRSTNGSLTLEDQPTTCGSTSLPYDCYPKPSKLRTPVLFSSITAGTSHFCGMEVTTGNAYCWGANTYGQLGLIGSPQATYVTAPTAVGGGLKFKSLSAGQDFTCGVSTAGDIWCWGMNIYAQLGYAFPSLITSLGYGPLRLFPVTGK